MKTLISLIVALCAGAPALAADEIRPNDVGAPVAWGAAENVTSLRHLRFGGQPDEAGLRAARDAGVEIVVNLRSPDEQDFDERAVAEALGLEYHNIPVVMGAPFTKATFDEIEEIVVAGGGKVVLLHCASGNRAAAWLAGHLVDSHGLEKEDALAVAERAGLTNDSARAATEAYLEGR